MKVIFLSIFIAVCHGAVLVPSPVLPEPGAVLVPSPVLPEPGAVLVPSPVLPEPGASTHFRKQDDIGNYAFGYDEGHLSGGSFRKESGDALGNKIGSYGLREADGRIRVVNYVADAAGFRADVMTNEPGTGDQDPADATINKPAVLIPPPMVPEVVYPAPQPVVQPPVVSEVVYTVPKPVIKPPILSEVVYPAPQPIAKPPVLSEVVYPAPQPIAKPPVLSEVVYPAPQPIAKPPVLSEVIYAAPQPVLKPPVVSEVVNTIAGPVIEYAASPIQYPALPLQYPASPNVQYGVPSVAYPSAQPRPQYSSYPGIAVQSGYLPSNAIVQAAVQNYVAPGATNYRGLSRTPGYAVSPQNYVYPQGSLTLSQSGLYGYYL